jgi:hypothetical protein
MQLRTGSTPTVILVETPQYVGVHAFGLRVAEELNVAVRVG